jgi:transcriptional regulator with XRE-family HTH domain
MKVAYDYAAFAARLRQVRIEMGLTEEEVAAVAGRTVETWRRYETTGRGQITLPLVKFASRYNLSLDWLFDGDGPRTRGTKTVRLVSETAVQSSRSIAPLRMVSTRS